MRSVLTGALLAAALAGCTPTAVPRPNVLLVVIDTCRADRCGLNGYAAGTTPELDAFAEDAVTFTDAWSPSCWTSPAHASLFSGQRPPFHGLMEGVRGVLDARHATLAESRTQGGYATGCFTNNPNISSRTNLTQGFAHVDPIYETVGGAIPTSSGTHERLLAWIRAQPADGRWFAFVNHMEPHLPYQPVESIRDRRLGGGVPRAELEWAERFGPPLSLVQGLGVASVSSAQRQLLSSLYDAEIETVDHELGTLFRALSAEGRLDDTLVVVTSDHGENLGDHGLYDHRMSLHRSLLHVPLVVRLPGVFDGGRRETSVVRLEDVTSTVLELCRRPLPAGLQGASLRGELGGRVARAAHGTLQRFEAPLRSGFPAVDTRRLLVSIRSAYDGRHHLIRYSDGRVELYDVWADPGELDDLAPTSPAQVARLTELCDPF